MVAIVSGSGLGLFGSSLSTLGAAGIGGNAGLGRGGDRVYVNSATGNLVVQSQDEVLASLGLDLSLVRTYNSQGLLNDDNGDNWRLGVHQRVYGLTGTLNTTGSTITKVFGDGREVIYRYEAGQSRYVSTDGDGAHDTLNNSSGTWTWSDGSSRNTETYNSAGQLTQSRDADGNTTAYTYTGSLLTRIDDASGQQVHFDYSGNNLTQIRVVSNGQTQTLTRYTYDTSDRLIKVSLDLSPADNSVADNKVYTTTYTYEGTSHRVASITLPDGGSVTFGYNVIDGEHRITSYVDALGRMTTLTYTQAALAGGGPLIGSANAGALSTTPPDTYALDTAALSGVPATTSTYGLNVGAGNPSPVVSSYTDGGHVVGTLHADGTLTSYVYDANGALVSTRRHANPPVAPLWSQDFSQNANGFSPLHAGFMTHENGALTVTSRDDVSSGYRLSVADRVYDFSQHVVFRSEVTTGSRIGRDFTIGLRNETASRGHALTLSDRRASVSYFDESTQEVRQVQFGAVEDDTTYVVEFVTTAQGSTVYLYEKGTQRENGRVHRLAQTDWGTSQLCMQTYGAMDWPASASVRVDNISESSASGALIGPWTAVESAQDIVTPAQGWGHATLLETGSADAGSPNIAFDSSGNGIAVWVQGNDVVARRYDRLLARWSAPTVLDSAGGEAYAVKLAMDRNTGNAVVAWLQNDGTTSSVYASVLDHHSGAWGAAQLLESSSQSAAQNLDGLAVSISGSRAAVSWLQSDGTRNNVYWSRLDGDLWSGAALVESVDREAKQPQVAIAANGNVSFVWRQDDGVGERIYARRWNASTFSFDSAQIIDTTSDGGEFPKLAFDEQGNGFAVWRQPNGLQARRFDASSGTWSAASTVATNLTGSVGWQLAVDATGNALVGWASNISGQSSLNAVKYDAAAGAWGTPSLVTTFAADEAQPGHIAVALNGVHASITWLQPGASVNDVYAARLTSSGWTAPQLLEGLPDYTNQLRTAVDNSGNVTVLWQEIDGLTTPSIFQQRYTSSSSSAYVVPAGATWQSVAHALYRVNSAAAGTALQAALGNPSLAPGAVLTSLPLTLSVTVAGNGNVLNSSLLSREVPANRLYSGVPVQGVAAAASAWTYYTIDVPAGTDALTVFTRGGTGNANLYIRHGAQPDQWDSDAHSNGAGTNESVTVADPAAGTWYIGVQGITAISGVELLAQYQSDTDQVTTLTAGEASGDIHGFGFSTEKTRLFQFEIPSGTTNFRLDLSGPSAGFGGADGETEILLKRGSMPVDQADADYAASGDGSNRSISVTTPQAGTWYVRVGMEFYVNDAKIVFNTNVAGTPPTVSAAATAAADSGAAVNLNATGADVQGAVSYQWTQIGGPSVTLTNTSSATASFVAPGVSSPTVLTFRVKATDSQGASDTDVVRVLVNPPPSYLVQAGDTWSSIAQALYGSNTVATQLQTALGNPSLTAGSRLTGLPVTINGTSASGAHYTIPSGATWQSIANALYGVNTAAAGSALQAALGNPPLTTGNELTNIPATLNVPTATIYNLNAAAVGTQGIWSTPSVLETETAAGISPQIRFDEDGNGFAVWVQDCNVVARRYNASTNSWSAAVTLDTRSNEVLDSWLAIDRATGNALSAWIQSDGVGNSVYASVFDVSTGTWSAPQLLESAGGAAREDVSLSIAGTHAAVAWVQHDSTSNSVYLSTLASGTWRAPDLLESSAEHASQVQVAVDGGGNATVVWRQLNESGDPRAYLTRWNQATQTYSGSAVLAGNGSQQPQVAMDAQGNAIVMWVDWSGVMVRRFDVTSGIWGASTQLAYDPVGIYLPDLAVDAAGNALVAWARFNGNTRSVYASRYDAGTQKWSSPQVLENLSTDVDGDSRLTVSLAGNNGLVAWAHMNEEGCEDLYAARLSNGTWKTPLQLDARSSGATQPSATIDAAGNISVVWLQIDDVTDWTSSVFQTRFTPQTSSYTIPGGATWQSIANTLYGVNSAIAGSALQSALGNPPLTAGNELTSLPATLSVPKTTSYNLNVGAVGTQSSWSAPSLLETGWLETITSKVRFDAAGNGLAVWVQGREVLARRYTTATDNWSAPATLNTGTGEVVRSSLAVDRVSGNAIAAWVQYDGAAYSMYANVFDAATGTWGAERLLEAGDGAASIWDFSLSIAGTSAAVAWVQDDGTSNSLYLATIANGSWRTADLLESSVAPAKHVDVVVDPAGNTTVLWSQPNSQGIDRVRVNRWNQATQTYSGASPLDVSANGGEAPRVASDALGNLLALWVDTNGLQSRRFDVVTGTWGTVSAVGPAPGWRWDLSVDASGNALVAWQEGGGDSRSVYATLYDAVTQTWSESQLLENFSRDIDGEYLPVAAMSGGNAVVAWIHNNGNGNHLYAVRLSNGSWSEPALLDSRPEQAGAPNVAIDAAGNITVTWHQTDGENTSLYHARYASATYFTIPSGATWQSIANTLYGVNSAAAGSALQSALGNPPLNVGSQLTKLPATLNVVTTVPAYYTVQSGDTWASITETIYGTNEANAVVALQSALSNPSLTAGSRLIVPLTLNYNGASTLYLHTDVRDALGQVTTYVRDADGRLTSILSPTVNGSRLETRYGYDADGNVTTVTEDPTGLNRVTTFGYDQNGNLQSTRDSLGNTVTRTYNANNQLLTETQYLLPDPDGAGSGQPTVPLTTRYAYDAENHLRFVISAEGRVTEHRYNSVGQRILTINYIQGSYTSTTTFDESAMVTWASTQNLWRIERLEYVYDFRGQLSTVTTYSGTDEDGTGLWTPAKTRYLYDQRGLLLQTIHANNGEDPLDPANPDITSATTYTYDGRGRVLSTVKWVNWGGALNTTLSVYDDANRQTTTTLESGLIVTSTYNVAGELISVTNGVNWDSDYFGTTKYAYDDAGRLRIVTDPLGVRQFQFYDAAGRKVGQIDGDGSLTEFVYNAAGQVTKTVGYAVRLDAGARASLVDWQGRPTALGLDDLRACASETPWDDHITRNVYNEAGQLIAAIDGEGGVTAYAYDGAGRLTHTQRIALSTDVPREIDELSPEELGDYLNPPCFDRLTRYFYDDDGKLLATLDAEQYLIENRYDQAGRLVEQIRYSQRIDSSQWMSLSLDELRPSCCADDQRHQYFYDAQGRKTGERDAEGYVTCYVYTPGGDLAAERRYDKPVAYREGDEFDYIWVNQLEGPDVVSRTRDYGRDGTGRVTLERVTYGRPDHTSTTETHYLYDTAGRLVAVERAVGTENSRRTVQHYDALGRVTEELSAEGYALIESATCYEDIEEIWRLYGTSYEYDLAGRRISATSRPYGDQVNTTHFYYDEDGRLRFEVNALGEVKERRYDAFGQLTDTLAYTTRIDTENLCGGPITEAFLDLIEAADESDWSNPATTTGRTRYGYTHTGLLSFTMVKTRADGEESMYTESLYDRLGQEVKRMVSVDGDALQRYSFYYDNRGRVLEQRDYPSGDVIEARHYDAFGRLICLTDARGNSSQFEYDHLGRQVATVDALDGRRSMVYDAFSRTMITRDALGKETVYCYDDENRKMTVTTPEGISVTTYFNEHGQEVLVYTESSRTHYLYDKNGRLTYASDELGGLGTNIYDRGGRLLMQVDQYGVVTKMLYDAANRVLTRIEDFTDGGMYRETSYTYDGQGRLTKVEEPSGRITETTYDRAGRVQEVVINAATLNIRTYFEYNRVGALVALIEGYGSLNPRRTEYVYDLRGRRTEETVDAGIGINPVTGLDHVNARTQYRYDENGNLTRKIDAEGNSTWYVYDENNRLTHTIDALGGVTKQIYDAENRVVETRRYASALGSATMSVLRDPAFNVATTDDFSVTDGQADRVRQFVYDADGRQRYTIENISGTQALVTMRSFDHYGNVVLERVVSQPIAAAAYRGVDEVEQALVTAGAVVEQIGANDRVRHNVYDKRGREVFTIDALGGITRTIHRDSEHSVVSVSYATRLDPVVDGPLLADLNEDDLVTWVGAHASTLDRQVRTWYDVLGREVFVLDAAGYLSETQYDDATRQKREIRYAGGPVTTLAADADEATVRALALVHGYNITQDRTTVTQFDAAGRITQVTDAEQKTEYYGYDAVGNRIWFTNKNGAIKEDENFTWRYVYDAVGHCVKETAPAADVTIVTAVSGGLTSSLSAGVKLETTFRYDDLGNLLSRTEAANTSQARTTSYEYDELGRQIITRFPAAEVYNYTTGLVELDSSLYTKVTYDVLGNAIYAKDVEGNYSHKGYDTLGRVTWEVDAKRYLTSYIYDTFGNATETRRFAAAVDANASEVRPVVGYPSSPAVGASDRVLVKEYDHLNRVTKVIEPSGYVFDSSITSSGVAGAASPQTVFTYDAFGQVIRESKLVHGVALGTTPPGPDAAPSIWASTHRYYDNRGLMIAEVDAEKYLTSYEYDQVGNLTDKTEYAVKLGSVILGTVPTPSATAPTEATGRNRHIEYNYDRVNRLTSEHFVDLQYFDFSEPTEYQIGTSITSYGYDAVGNRTRVTVNGASTYSYYDALGRVIGIAEPTRSLGYPQQIPTPLPSTSITPYMELFRDAHGNIVKHVEYAGDIGSVSTTRPTVSSTVANDWRNRVTLTRYDLHGRVVESGSAAQVVGQAANLNSATYAVRHAAYTKRGELAKQWQTIQTVDPSNLSATISETISTVYHYDALGRQTKIIEPQDGTRVRTAESDYNAFGEIVERRTLNANGSGVFGTETFEYDGNGRLWRTNADSGVYRVYLYDLSGQATAELKSQSVNLRTSGDLSTVLALSAGSLMRSETAYDLLGRATEQRGPTFALLNSAWVETGPAVTRTTQAVDRWGNVTSVTDALNRETNYYYDQRNNVIKVQHPYVDIVDTSGTIIRDDPNAAPVRGRPVAFNHYDLNGNLIGKNEPVDPRDLSGSTGLPAVGPVFRITYNAVGQVIAETANNVSKRYTVDRFGQRVQAVDEMDYKTRYQYDQSGNLTGLARERGRLAFEAEGFNAPTDFPTVQRPTGPLGQATGLEVYKYAYDEAGRRISETTGEFVGDTGNEQETIRYWYDLHGNLIRKREPMGEVTRPASDSSTVVIRYETTYEYDVNGQKTREVDGNGSSMTWTYDSFGQLQGHKQLTNANGWVASSKYGADGDTITYTYNHAGLLEYQSSVFGQRIDYQYDAAGHLSKIADDGLQQTHSAEGILYGIDRDTNFRYNELGQRIGEQTIINGLTHQNAAITYDELGRLKSVTDVRSSVEYSYDSRGNRTRVEQGYYDNANAWQTHEDWYVYDALNRVKIGQGALKTSGSIWEVEINANQGIELTYDARGNRATSKTYGKRLVEQQFYVENTPGYQYSFGEENGYDEHRYSYDGLSRLITDTRYMDFIDENLERTNSGLNVPNGAFLLVDERWYDYASRQVSQVTRTPMTVSPYLYDQRVTNSTYDDNGRITRQTTGLNGLMESDIQYGVAFYDPGYNWPGDPGTPGESSGYYSPAGWTPGYDAAGVLRGYRLHAYPQGRSAYFTNHSFEYALADGYLEVAHTAQSTSTTNNPPQQPGSNRRIYNVNGELVSYYDPADTSGTNNRVFATNAQGQVLTAVSGNYVYSSNLAWLFSAVVEHDPQWGPMPNAQLYRYANGQYIGTFGTLQTGSFEANFDSNFEPISSNYPAATPAQVTIQSGDTLRSIAARVFGDGSLWYILADANGITDGPDALLDEKVGWSLRIPNEVIALSNNGWSFKPFSVSDALGDTSPVQPAPPPPRKKKGCGIIGQIIVIVVAIVVTYFTAGATANALGPVVSSMVGAAAGSVASQLVGMALGVQEGFSWKAVAVAGLTAGITKGLGVDKLSVVGQNASSVVNQAINGVISNAIGQGVSIAVGLQDKFSWRDLAISAVSAPIVNRVGTAIGKSIDPNFGVKGQPMKFTASFASGLAAGGAGVAVRMALGGKVDTQTVLADVFGNALGNSLIEGVEQWRENRKVDEVFRRAGIDPNDPFASPSLLRTARGLVQEGRSVADVATFIGDAGIREGLFGSADTAAENISRFTEEELNQLRGAGGPGSSVAESTVVDPETGQSIPLVITEGTRLDAVNDFADGVLHPVMDAAAAFGDFAARHETLAELAASGTQLALMGPAQFVKSTVMDLVVDHAIGDEISAVRDYVHGKAASFIEERWGFDTEEAGFLAHGVVFGGQVVLDSAAGLVRGAKDINQISRLRDERGRYASDPNGRMSARSARDEYIGSNPSKTGPVGRKVIERMRSEGRIDTNAAGQTIFKSSDGNWYPLKDADMSHLEDASKWWNREGRHTGARSRQVRDYQSNPDNFELEYFRHNRARGHSAERYLPPVPKAVGE